MKVAIIGSRNYPDIEKVVKYVEALPEGTTIISGCASGVDSTAERSAKQCGLPLMLFPVRTIDLPYGREDTKQEFGKRAYARNASIVAECDRVVAFWDGSSKGTKNTMDLAKAAGKVVEIL